MARIGLLGGTFNPPHLGHLVCAAEAFEQLELDRVLLVPVNQPPHKEIESDPGVEHRVEMCRRAVSGDERLGVSRVEADVPGRSFTVDTLRKLHAARPEDELTFILGGDQARDVPAWKEPEAILALATLGVAEREDVRRAEITEHLCSVEGARERVTFFAMPRIDLSSSLMRRRVAAGRPLRYLVTDAVAAYIERERLYRQSDAVSRTARGVAAGDGAAGAGDGEDRRAAA